MLLDFLTRFKLDTQLNSVMIVPSLIALFLDLLTRFKLYTLANSVMKLSKHPAVECLNQNSTTVHTSCSTCSKPMIRAGWLCDRCTNRIHTCSLW